MARFNKLTLPKPGLNEFPTIFNEGPHSPVGYTSTAKLTEYEHAMRLSKRADSPEIEEVVEVVPDDPFKDIASTEDVLYIEPKVELDEDEEQDEPTELSEFQENFGLEFSELQNAEFEEVTNTTEIYNDDDHQRASDHEDPDFITEEPVKNKKIVLCAICNSVFSTRKRLRLHMAQKHERFSNAYIHKCDICKISYDKKVSLIMHMKRKHGSGKIKEEQGEFTCKICSLFFVGSRRLRLHMHRKHDVNEESFQYKCHECNLSYENQQSLRIHIKRKHTQQTHTKELLNCQFCPKTFHVRVSYVKHMQTKHSTSDVKNELDDASVDDISALRNEGNDELVCSECSLLFADMNKLRIHMRRKHNVNSEGFKYKCSQCTLSYSKRQSLIQHIKRKHNKSMLKCEVCQKQFPNHTEFDKHSHGKEILECHICKMIFSQMRALRLHLKFTHKVCSDPDNVFCHICGNGYPNDRNLRAHIQKVHSNIHYTCPHCSKVFKLKESFQKHILSKHPVVTSKSSFVCQYCNDVFETENELCKHVSTEHNESEEPKIKKEIKSEGDADHLQCTKCGEQFATWDKLSYHYKRNHIETGKCERESELDGVCPHCGGIFPPAEMNTHIIKNHADKIETFNCKNCEYVSHSKVLLYKHEMRHVYAKRFVCTHVGCNYKTHFKSLLQKHTETHMEKVKLYCSKCAFNTNNKYTMKYHEEEHVTGKKKYRCDKCEYSTNLPANIVQHRYKHLDVKTFRCEKCTFASKYSTALWYHMKTRHSDTPYVKPCLRRKGPPKRKKKNAGVQVPASDAAVVSVIAPVTVIRPVTVKNLRTVTED